MRMLVPVSSWAWESAAALAWQWVTESPWLRALQWRSGERQVWELQLLMRRMLVPVSSWAWESAAALAWQWVTESPWLRALQWRSGERQVWELQLLMRRCLSQPMWEHVLAQD